MLPCRLGARLSDGRTLFSPVALRSALQSPGSPPDSTSDEASARTSCSSNKQVTASLTPAEAPPRPAGARAQAHAPGRVLYDAVIQSAGALNGSSTKHMMPEVDGDTDEDHLIISELDELLAGLKASASPAQAVAKDTEYVELRSKQLPAAGLPTFIGRPADKQDGQAQHKKGSTKHRYRLKVGALHPAFIRQRGMDLTGDVLMSGHEEPHGRGSHPVATASGDNCSADSAGEGPCRNTISNQQSSAAGAADGGGCMRGGSWHECAWTGSCYQRDAHPAWGRPG